MRNLKNELIRLWKDESGAEGLEKILIIAALVLPLLGVLLYFKDAIVEWLSGSYSEIKNKSGGIEDPGFD